MKNVFAHIALASFVAVPSLIAAEAIGLVPALPISAESLIGGYVAGGLLAFAFHDYGHGLTPRQPRPRKSSRPQPTAQPAGHHPVVGWEHHTISA